MGHGLGTPTHPSIGGATALASDSAWSLVEGLRDGDEAAFIALIGRHHAPLVRLARLYVPDQAAEDLVDEVWGALLADLGGLDRGVSFRVVLFRLLLDRARSRRPEGARPLPFAAEWDARSDARGLMLRGLRFQEAGPWIGHWAAPMSDWQEIPEERLLTRETLTDVAAAICALPPAQREVITLRDVEGWTSDEVGQALGIAEAAQRALLHRARTEVRAALDACLRP
jgi:RNA polymerase sigma-70 factor (ECF subfamily)